MGQADRQRKKESDTTTPKIWQEQPAATHRKTLQSSRRELINATIIMITAHNEAVACLATRYWLHSVRS